MYADVALPIPALAPLTYRIPDTAKLVPGVRVEVPLSRRVLIGIVTAQSAKAPDPSRHLKLKSILRVVDEIPALSPELMDLGQWLAGYYRCSWGEALMAMLPSLLPALTPSPSAAPLSVLAAAPEPPLTLTPHQSRALESIITALVAKSFSVFLLHGVTGSGKTEVYLRAIAQVLAQGQTAILLVPEIALTPQMLGRVHARFQHRAVVLHSGLTPKARAQAWLQLRHGPAQVVVGARSAVFAPLSNLGLIVVDEEYDDAYKQEDSPRYHARDVAAMRARSAGAVLLLGSATPSLESFTHARQGRYHLLTLPQRVDNKQLPRVAVVDMSQEMNPQGRIPLFSQALLQALDQRLQAREQSILFLNRRGFAPWIVCRACRHVVTCPRCSVSLVYHRPDDILRCHHCGHHEALPPACPQCHAPFLRLSGMGTQRVENELQEHFPHARILRLDQDAVKSRGSLERTLDLFSKKEADILVGTQMVAKGMDFPDVTLVGIVSADTALHLPDFRAEERTFQLLVQVAGRAGRGGQPGMVLVQTFNPLHPIITLAQAQDYLAFYAREMGQRQELHYPPLVRLANILFRGRNAQAVEKAAQTAASRLRSHAGPRDTVLGPAQPLLQRLADESRFQLLLKSPSPSSRNRLLNFLEGHPLPSTIKMSVDVDPYHLL